MIHYDIGNNKSCYLYHKLFNNLFDRRYILIKTINKHISLTILIVAVIMTTLLCTSCKGKEKEIAFITNMGPAMDHSYNQAIWDGVLEYSKKNKKNCQAYEPEAPSPKAYETAMEQAIDNGAKIVIASDYLFQQPVFHLQSKYPNVKFILLNAQSQDENGKISYQPNTLSVTFKEEQIGFLAGYMAVKDGYRKLGFMGGMQIPSIIRNGYGFSQGAEYAAKELKLEKGEVSIHYTHLQNFDDTEGNISIAKEWYHSDGVEVIYACSGNAIQSIVKATSAKKGKVIGYHIDQSNLSKTVVSSVVKNYSKTVYDAIVSCYDNTFKGGINKELGIKENGVGILFDKTSFQNTTKQDYDPVMESLKNNRIKLYREQDKKEVTNIPFEWVTIIPIK